MDVKLERQCKGLRVLASWLASCLNSVLNVKALVGAFNQEKALLGAFSVTLKTDSETDGALQSTI